MILVKTESKCLNSVQSGHIFKNLDEVKQRKNNSMTNSLGLIPKQVYEKAYFFIMEKKENKNPSPDLFFFLFDW